ncbi:uncharacterized protein LOC121769748 [Salvia splendens]|uniref:uncharacterized protein LOC121769748 n=1 Tax=Salvia splendens TaxID=180675 RepID=UPI001C25351F|nr:uncharacterized protein LOC121769748 [Salvia splendens]
MASSAAAYPQNPRESPRPLQFHQIPLPRNWTNTHSNWTQLSHQNSSNAVLEEEIQDLTLKLDELQYKLRIKGSTHFHSTNILKQTTLSDSTNHEEEARAQENKCSGRCKAVVLRIVEQVRAEAEQWSQMRTMLEQVRPRRDGRTAGIP